MGRGSPKSSRRPTDHNPRRRDRSRRGLDDSGASGNLLSQPSVVQQGRLGHVEPVLWYPAERNHVLSGPAGFAAFPGADAPVFGAKRPLDDALLQIGERAI